MRHLPAEVGADQPGGLIVLVLFHADFGAVTHPWQWHGLGVRLGLWLGPYFLRLAPDFFLGHSDE